MAAEAVIHLSNSTVYIVSMLVIKPRLDLFLQCFHTQLSNFLPRNRNEC